MAAGSLLAVAAAACGSSAKSAQVEGPEIANVGIVGNHAVGDKTLIRGLATHDPRGLIRKRYARYDPAQVDDDKKRIEGYYKRRGFFSARVTDVDVDRRGERVTVSFRVEEGRPSRITGVELQGLPPRLTNDPKIEELEGRFERGSIYRQSTYENAKVELRRILASRGYAWAAVKGVVEVDRDRAEASIQFDATPGPRVRYGETQVIGLEDIPKSAVTNRLTWNAGEVYDPTDFDRTRNLLYELGFFRGVRISLQRINGGADEVRAPVTIELSEVDNRELRLGAGFALDNAVYEVRGRAGYTMRHFLDPLATLRIDLKPAYTVVRGDTSSRGFAGEGSVTLDRYDLILPRVKGQARLSVTQIELETYTSRGPDGRISLGRGLLDGSFGASVGWEIERLTFPRINPAIDPETAAEIDLVDPYRLAFFDQRVGVDRRDDALDAHSGYFADLRVEEGGRWAGGEFDYVKATADVRGYLPLLSRLVAAARLVGGDALSGNLPVTQRYFAGGASSHRGFGTRQLAPITSSVDPETGDVHTTQIGGNTLLLTSVELRYDVVRLWDHWLGTVVFLDGGDVTLDESDLDLGNLNWATGLGLRYNTAAGPIRVDVGYRLNRTGPGNPEAGQHWAFHLSLGEAF